MAASAALLLVGCRAPPWKDGAIDVSLSGIDDKASREKLYACSSAWQYRFEPDVDAAQLDSWARGDALNMARYLHSEGYCAASVTASVATAKDRPHLQFFVAHTNRYRIRMVTVDGAPPSWQDRAGWTNTLAGGAADFALVADSGRRLVRALRNAGYPYATLADTEAVVDHDAAAVDIRYRLSAGGPATFGHWKVSGLRTVDPRFVERRITWKADDTYRQDVLDDFRSRLSASGLFSFVDVQGPDPAATSAVYDLDVRLVERKRRTLGLGLGYQSDIGAEATVLWQHRNLFGMGQRFEIDGKYAEELWRGTATLSWPDLPRQGTEFQLGLVASEEDSDAYFVRYETLYASLKRQVGGHTTLRYGPAVRESRDKQRDLEESYWQASLPVNLLWDRRNDLLNATRGCAFDARLEPTQDLEDSDRYLTTVVTPTAYAPLGSDNLVLSVRATVGSVTGTDIEGIPPDLRFYAGGGQSIRGYAYQSVGPREDGQLTGGRSLVETSFELRARFRERLGLVLFVDGGSAYEPELTDFSESYQWGAGVGFRYFTAMGPVRADFGVPVNPRDGIDDDFEFYISIGQAF